jgi:hypothetical protein
VPGAKRFAFEEDGAEARATQQCTAMRSRLRLQIIPECRKHHSIHRDGFGASAQQLRAQLGRTRPKPGEGMPLQRFKRDQLRRDFVIRSLALQKA